MREEEHLTDIQEGGRRGRGGCTILAGKQKCTAARAKIDSLGMERLLVSSPCFTSDPNHFGPDPDPLILILILVDILGI